MKLEDHTKSFIKKIEKMGFTDILVKDIAYGKNITSYYNGKKTTFRIYFSKKKGITEDFSQVKDSSILELFDKKEGFNVKKKKKYNFKDNFEYFSIGSDEGGKGDLIGPLITAAVYTDDKLAETFKILEIKDSKEIKSFKKLEEAYKNIISSTIYHIDVLEPKDYNKEYKIEQNINKVLANAHIRAMNSVIKQAKDKNLKVNKLIIDRFSKKEYFSFDIETVQIPKAEQFMSVAAASILARYTHLKYYEDINKRLKKHKISFSPGMNPKNLMMLNRYLDNYSEQSLFYLVKLNFKTVNEILYSRRERELL